MINQKVDRLDIQTDDWIWECQVIMPLPLEKLLDTSVLEPVPASQSEDK